MQGLIWLPLAFLAGLLWAWLFHRLSLKTGLFLDHSDVRKRHGKSKPRGAGMVFALVFLLWLFLTPQYRPLWPAGTLLVAFAFLDDLRNLNPYLKLLVQLVVGVLVYYGGSQINGLDVGLLHFHLGAFSMPFTVFYVVGMTNAFNFIDGLDGLAGSIAAVSFALIGLVAALAGMGSVGTGALLIGAAVVGFLLFNAPPARVFMGDVGSYTLGFAVALFSIETFYGGRGLLLVPAVLIAGFPVMDISLAIIRRIRARRHLFVADRRHIHHLLLAGRIPPVRTVLLLTGCSLLSGMMGVAAWFFPGSGLYFLGLYLAGGLLFAYSSKAL